jgi:hypothetical protein
MIAPPQLDSSSCNCTISSSSKSCITVTMVSRRHGLALILLITCFWMHMRRTDASDAGLGLRGELGLTDHAAHVEQAVNNASTCPACRHALCRCHHPNSLD